jgi:hypothetical protein
VIYRAFGRSGWRALVGAIACLALGLIAIVLLLAHISAVS